MGETLAALLAVERLAGATDPAVRSTLEAIARDEARHAALAYRFVAWAIASGGEPIRRAACAAFDRALGDLVGPPVAAPTAARTALLQHGVASEADTRAAVRAAMDEVIVPAARQLGRGAGVEASTPAPRIDVALYLPRFKSAANETIVFCQ